MSIQGPLYRRSQRLFNKTGSWNAVWCELHVPQGDLVVYLEHNGPQLLTIPIRECDIEHVRSDGRDCIEINIGKTKKETFSSLESSYDVDWWMNTLLSVQRDLKHGNHPSVTIVCPPAADIQVRHRSVRRPSSNNISAIVRPTLRRRQPSLAASVALFERFTIYETSTEYYIVCSDRHYSRFRMLQLDRTIERPTSLDQIFKEDVNLYTWDQMEAKLQALAEQAKADGGGKLVRAFAAVAIVGCIRFLRGYYFIFVTQRRKIGCIGGNFIYGISGTQQLNVSRSTTEPSTWTWVNRWLNPNPEEDAEARYLGLFHFLDLTKDFYFSYSYDITHTLQHNMTTERSEPAEMFTWNAYLTQELKTSLSPGAAADLIIPFVLGCYEQRKCSVFGRLVSIILLARRSRHFAGTRYLKRGVSDTGKAANDVEMEQIIEDENMGAGKFSSFVQYRGSIPVFWSQETSATLPKPPIVLNRVDPTYSATQKHFADLLSRYGSNIVALNLVKQTERKEREVIVGNEFMNAVEYLNSFMPPEHRIRYVALDYSRLSKQKGLNVLHSLDKVAVWGLTQTGFFCSAPKRQIGSNGNKRNAKVFFSQLSQESSSSEAPDDAEGLHRDFQEPPASPTIPRKSGDWLEQKGVLRTNCIDCLDRTNVSQFCVGMRALGQQLYAMGIRNTPILESRSQLVRVLMLLYSLVGDAISMQYGGSEAHKSVKNKENGKHRELLTSIRRYYSNSFTDNAKQDAINIFLGHFVPKENEPPLWELENDYYLHNFEVPNGAAAYEQIRRSVAFHEENKRKSFGIDLQASMSSSSSELSLLVDPGQEIHDFIDPTNEEMIAAIRIQQKREAYIRECRRILEDWWKEPLEKFERPKYYIVKDRSRIKSQGFNEKFSISDLKEPSSTSAEDGNVELTKKVPISPCSDGFLQMYHPEELTSFDKALGSKFMIPMDLSHELHDDEKPKLDQNNAESIAITASASSSSYINPEDNRPDAPSNQLLRISTKYSLTTRTGRSMSAPDIGEELERRDTTRRGRDSSREYKAGEDDYGEGVAAERMTSFAVLPDSSRPAVPNDLHSNKRAPFKSALKRRDDQMSLEEYMQNRGRRKFIGDCSRQTPDSVYERYVLCTQSPSIWESENESVKMYFEAYLRENNIDPDDARSLRDAQICGGASFKVQSGPYAGLDQNVKARVLVGKKLKTTPEDRKIFEESLDYKRLVTKSCIPADSMDLYKSFFAESLPDVAHKKSGKLNEEGVHGDRSSNVQFSRTLGIVPPPKTKRNGGATSDLISVGPLFKLDGGKDQEFILFNEAAAENSFGEVVKNATELSFYTK